MGKLIARALGPVLLLLVPAISFALGLGPITMRSSLNQPLDAEIDIQSAQPGDLDGFAVRLASNEDFARVNIERSSFLTQIAFQLKTRSDGSAFIHLTTTRPITEPYLDFIIEARWARGRALKEYTVLVDPPVLTAEAPAPVEQAGTSPVFEEPAAPKQQISRRPINRPIEPVRPPPQFSRPAPVRQAAPPPREEEPLPEGDVNYGRVKRGDTLYEIAKNSRPNDSVSINQMMLAYLRDNPEAFIGGNINKLKAGYVLRIKDATQISNVSRQQAVSEVRRQNLAWREGRSTRLVKQGEPESAPKSTSRSADQLADLRDEESQGSSAKSEGPKVVLAKKDREATEGSAGSSADNKKNEAAKVKEDLLLAAESLDATRQESEELDARMAELQEQMQSMQRLIMIKDNELNIAQNQADKPQPKPQQPPAANKQAEKAKQQAAKAKGADKKKESSFMNEMLSDPVLLGLMGLLVIAVVGWLVVRRRRMHGGFDESILNVGAGSIAPVAAEASSGGPESAMVSDFVMSDMSGAQIDASEVDAISEADVYLAYGRHQQAEDILRQALDKTPDQLDLHAKLLEVFHAAKDADAFEAQARILHEKIGGNESNQYWTDILPLGRDLCPHSDLFGGGGGFAADDHLGVSADDEDLLDFDFDENTDITAVAPAAASEADNSLDFDMSALDLDLDSSSNSPARAPESYDMPASGSNDDAGLDFDMSFEEDNTANAEEEPLSMDFDTGGFEMDSTEEDLTAGGYDFDSESEADSGLSFAEEDAPLELSMEDAEEDSSEPLSMDYEQSADIVQFDAGGDIDLDGELDEDIFSNVDEVGTKLDLAKAYVDMGDSDGARSILDEVLEEGDDSQKQQAEELLQQMG